MAQTLTGLNQPSGGAPFATDNSTIDGGRVLLVKPIFGLDGSLKFVEDAAGNRLPVKAVMTDATDADVKTGDAALAAERVTLVGGAQVAALQIDNAPAALGTDGGVPAMFIFNDSSAQMTAASAGFARMSKDRMVHIIGAPHAQKAQKTTAITTTAETTILSAGAAGIYHDISFLGVYNSNTATPVVISFRDTTGGPIVYQIPLSEKGGSNIPFGNDHWAQSTPATNWTASLSAAVATVYINVSAVKRVS
jgi:hypothetical protein